MLTVGSVYVAEKAKVKKATLWVLGGLLVGMTSAVLAGMVSACGDENTAGVADAGSFVDASDDVVEAGDTDAGDGGDAGDAGEEVVRWPFDEGVAIRVSNTLSTLQFYSATATGFHHGLDLLADAGTPVYAPISGLVGTRYYFWIENDYTYEIWIETDAGMRYEIHHVDKSTIPQEIEDLAAAGGRIEQGTYLGNVYDGIGMGVESHIHINVLDQEGYHVNPLFWLPEVPDSIAPSLNRIYFVVAGANGFVETDSCEIVPDQERCNLVLDAHDGFDESPWDQSLYQLDFYLMVNGDWQHIRGFEFEKLPYLDYLEGADEIYWLEPFEDADGAIIENQVDTGSDRRFLYALPLDLATVPNETSSTEMRVLAQDFAGNTAEQTFSLTANP